ncbi:MAG: DMT family transporter [Acidimicrobiia bacterium]|nr:DMT family transporter [Acidimicrobiia bacterium]
MAAAVLAALSWAAGNIIVRTVPLPGIQVAFWRILLGAVVYTAIFVARGGRISKRNLMLSAPAGAVIAIEIAIFFVAIKATTVANAVVIGNLQPLILFYFASRRFGESINRWFIGVAVVAFIGVAIVVFGSSSTAVWNPWGDFLAFVAMLFFAAYFVLAKTARQQLATFEFQTMQLLVGSATLAPIAFVDAGLKFDVPSLEAWGGLALLLAIPGTGHLLMNFSHLKVKLSVTSLLTLGIPALSTLAAALFLDEPANLIQYAGMALVVTALATVITRESRLRSRAVAQTS